MATALEIISGALALLGWLPAGEEPAPDDAALALTGLNDMLASWEGKDVHIGASVLKLTDELPMEARHVGGVKALLAVWVAEPFRTPVSGSLQSRADAAWRMIQADFRPLDELRVDVGFQLMSSQRRSYR